MNSAQIAFLKLIADRIPRLMVAIQQGNQHAEYVIGRRIIAGRQVRLVLLAEVVDPGGNPMATHSTPSTSPSTPSAAEPDRDSSSALSSGSCSGLTPRPRTGSRSESRSESRSGLRSHARSRSAGKRLRARYKS